MKDKNLHMAGTAITDPDSKERLSKLCFTAKSLDNSYVKLYDARDVSFDFILKECQKDHPNDEKLIRKINYVQCIFGKWISTKILTDDLGSIVLPYHSLQSCLQSCSDKKPNIILIPKEGCTLSEAYKQIEKFRLYAPECYDKILNQKKLILECGLRSIFLTEEPLPLGPLRRSYSGLKKWSRRLTHLDGFHRLLALMSMKEKFDYINCFVAKKSLLSNK